MVNDIDALLERVKAATGPDRELDEAIALALCDEHLFAQLADAPEGTGCEMYRMGHHSFSSALRVTASIDAALALTERVLPGWRFDVHSPRFGKPFEAILMDGDSASRKIVVADARTAPLAIIAATLSALRNRGAEQ